MVAKIKMDGLAVSVEGVEGVEGGDLEMKVEERPF